MKRPIACRFMGRWPVMMGNPRSRVAILVVASAVLLASAASAEKPAGKKQKPRQVPDAGVEEMVSSDPAGDARLEQMTSRSSEGLTVAEHDGGMLSVDLQGRFMNVMVVTPAVDGHASVSCLSGHEARKQAEAGKIAPTVPVGKVPGGTATRAADPEVQ
jgi:hypothetical protein